MLHLTANDTPLVISKVSLRLTLRSPVAGDNGGSYVYSTSIPNTGPNAAAFGFPIRLQRKNKLKSQKTGKIWWNNRIIQEGVWRAKTTGDEIISLEMLINAGIFADSIAGKNLPELFDVPVSVPDIVAHLESQVLKTYPEVNHNFPVIYNPQFYGDPKETDPKKNPNLQFEGFLNNYSGSFIENTASNRNTIVPQLYLAYIIQHIYESAGYTIKGNVLDDTMIKAALIYSNFALDKLQATAFFGELTPNTISISNILWDINLQDPGGLYSPGSGSYLALISGDYTIQMPITYQRNELYDFVIEVYYNSVLIFTQTWAKIAGNNNSDSIDLTIPYTIDLTNVNHNLYVKAFMYDGSSRPVTLISASISIANLTQSSVNIFTGDFNYKDLLPVMAVKDFLNAFLKSFDILPFFNENTKTVELVFYNDLISIKTQKQFPDGLLYNTLKITANDYEGLTFDFDFQGDDDFLKNRKSQENLGSVITTPLPPYTIGDVYFCESLNAYIRYDYDSKTKQFAWVTIGDRHPPFVIDAGKRTVPLPLSPMLMRKLIYNGLERNHPSISANGTSVGYQIKNDPALRIMFWAGINPANQYPFATTTKFDTWGNEVFPISWVAEEVASRYFNVWLAWLKIREKVEFTNELTAADLAALDFKAAYYFQSAQIILEEAYIKLQNRQLGPVKMTGWTV